MQVTRCFSLNHTAADRCTSRNHRLALDDHGLIQHTVKAVARAGRSTGNCRLQANRDGSSRRQTGGHRYQRSGRRNTILLGFMLEGQFVFVAALSSGTLILRLNIGLPRATRKQCYYQDKDKNKGRGSAPPVTKATLHQIPPRHVSTIYSPARGVPTFVPESKVLSASKPGQVCSFC